MSFRLNESQQMSMFDSFSGLTPREQKALDRSWAKVFGDEIFPMINEEPFRVLYSQNEASAPNTPANILIAAMIIKELFNASDDEMVENLMLDIRYQYAMHTTSFDEQPLSDKSLSRFRNRCYDHERLTGEDLLHDAIKSLGEITAKLMKIDGRIRRMDSTMIDSNIRKLSRTELLYRCIAKLVIYLHKNSHDDRIVSLEHYYDPNDFNNVIYHSRSTEVDEKIAMLLRDADKLLLVCGNDFEDVTEYQLLVRCLAEQTVVEDHARRLRTREDGGMDSSIMQSPCDPDATFREKAGKQHRGYVANLEESVGSNGTVVTDYQFEQNNTSDSEMLKEHLNQMPEQEVSVTLITDGAYSGTENQGLAASKNIELATTDLTGRDVDSVWGGFSFKEDGTAVTGCPAGHTPKSCSYNPSTGMCRVSFTRNQCEHCPWRMHCKPKIHKKVSVLMVGAKMRQRALSQAAQKTERHKLLARIRNGAETVPSILKNQYHANKMHGIRGKLRAKLFFGCKIGALNFRKLFRYRNGTGHYAPNPLLIEEMA